MIVIIFSTWTGKNHYIAYVSNPNNVRLSVKQIRAQIKNIDILIPGWNYE